jgi:hypothetical protein
MNIPPTDKAPLQPPAATAPAPESKPAPAADPDGDGDGGVENKASVGPGVGGHLDKTV